MPKKRVSHILDPHNPGRVLCGAIGDVDHAVERADATCKRCIYCLPSLEVLEGLRQQAE